MRVRLTVKIDEDLIKHARAHAATRGNSLSDVIEESLMKNLPTSINSHMIQMVGNPAEMKIEFTSGPTISQLKPNISLDGSEVK